jgi:hypothetical protein
MFLSSKLNNEVLTVKKEANWLVSSMLCILNENNKAKEIEYLVTNFEVFSYLICNLNHSTNGEILSLTIESFNVILTHSEESKQKFEKLGGLDLLEELQLESKSTKPLRKSIEKLMTTHF